MTRRYATHDSECTKKYVPHHKTNAEHNHFDLLRIIVYHNNMILHNAASTLDHFYTPPAKGIGNIALTSVSATVQQIILS